LPPARSCIAVAFCSTVRGIAVPPFAGYRATGQARRRTSPQRRRRDCGPGRLFRPGFPCKRERQEAANRHRIGHLARRASEAVQRPAVAGRRVCRARRTGGTGGLF
jgi:hypothetical protein